MRKPEIIMHQGKEIVYIDLSGLREVAEIFKLEDESAALIQSRGLNKTLTLTNMEGMFFNNEIRSHFAEVVKNNTPYVKASAVIGLSGLISIMYNGFVSLTGRNVKSFKSRAEALEYLTSI